MLEQWSPTFSSTRSFFFIPKEIYHPDIFQKKTQRVMEIHREIWNNDILRPELPLSLFNSNSAEFTTTGMGAQNGSGRKFTKARTLYKEVFHKTWYMREKIWRRWDHLLGLSAVSVRPLYQLEEKQHQIRAYILLIKVIAVRRHQIRVAFCQVDSITAVRHLVRGFPQFICSYKSRPVSSNKYRKCFNHLCLRQFIR